MFAATATQFGERLRSERHTVKRSLTDPTLFDGIGNAYSDEILWAAKMSPFRMTTALEPTARSSALHDARARPSSCCGPIDCAPRSATASPTRSPRFAPRWRSTASTASRARAAARKVQRIVYADNEANYCATCQTDGKLLADRSLSRLLKEDWPKTLEELEDRKRAGINRSQGF